jgi:myosin-1
VFDYEKVKNQVFYLGLLENIRVRRAGFAYRLTYDKFLHRYKCLSKKTWPNPPRSLNARDSSQVILKECNFQNDVQYGVTKVFIKSPRTVFSLESKRTDMLPKIVTLLQKVNFIFDIQIIKWIGYLSEIVNICRIGVVHWQDDISKNSKQQIK